MQIEVERLIAATVVHISGSVDGLTADTLLTAFQAEIDAGTCIS